MKNLDIIVFRKTGLTSTEYKMLACIDDAPALDAVYVKKFESNSALETIKHIVDKLRWESSTELARHFRGILKEDHCIALYLYVDPNWAKTSRGSKPYLIKRKFVDANSPDDRNHLGERIEVYIRSKLEYKGQLGPCVGEENDITNE